MIPKRYHRRAFAEKVVSKRYRFFCDWVSRGPQPYGPGAGRQRLRGMQGKGPCSGSRGEAPWVGCRVTTPARDARGRPLLGVQGRSVLGRVQGDNACAGCKGKTLAGNPKGSARGPVKCRASTLCTGYYLSKLRCPGNEFHLGKSENKSTT